MFSAEDILGSIWKLLKEDPIISADITAIQYVDFDKSVVTGATFESCFVENCITDDQCELGETDSRQILTRIPTASSCLQAIESIRQLM